MYGSIGAETESGLPYAVWKALPTLYPAEFEGRNDYSAFGFLYEKGADGKQKDLPIGISRRTVHGIDVVWFNCATCHVGTWRETPDAPPHVVPGMPSNNLDLYRFIRFVLDARRRRAAVARQPDPGDGEPGPTSIRSSKLVWRFYVIPRVREGLIERRSRLEPLLAAQPAWGPGRVDTFNPYKLLLELARRRARPRRRAGGHRRLSRHLRPAPARGHAAALGRQQQFAGRAQSLGRPRRRRDAELRSTTPRSSATRPGCWT